MGAGIAEVSARAGCDVVVREVDDHAAAASSARLRASIGRSVRSGRLAERDADEAVARVAFVTDIAALSDRELVIEAAPEVELVKTALFAELDAAVAPECVLASNTSSIPLGKLAASSSRPGRVVGLHFFNPVPVLPLVEVVGSLLTDAATLSAVTRFAEDTLGKRTVRSKDRAGFLVNALLIPYLLSAIRMLESGFASAEDIDAAMVSGCAHPMGPLALADLIGLDTTAAVADSLYAEFKEPLFAPPPLLLRMNDAGLLGRKAGRGFFPYAVSPAEGTT